MSILLVVRDPEKLLEACRTFIKIQHDEQCDLSGMALLGSEHLLGAWIDPTANILNAPDAFKVEQDEYHSTLLLRGCRIVDSFSLSGAWAICRLAFDSSRDMEPALQREALLQSFLRYRQSIPMLGPEVIGRFIPIFGASDAHNNIYREIQTLKLLSPGMITDFLMLDSSGGGCRIL